VILFTVGMRRELTRGAACSRCLAEHASAVSDRQRLPANCRIDDDSRELWEIPEARDYICDWARFAGLDHSAAVVTSPLDQHALAFLAKCGAITDIDPNDVTVGWSR
jgi:hypothetical protein